MSDISSLLARVRELDKASTPGPWSVEQRSEYVWDIHEFYEDDPPLATVTPSDAAATLIAEYRTAAPRLADECERLAAQLDNELFLAARRDVACDAGECIGAVTARADAAHAVYEVTVSRDHAIVGSSELRAERDALAARLVAAHTDRDTTRAEVAMLDGLHREACDHVMALQVVNDDLRRLLDETQSRLDAAESEVAQLRNWGASLVADAEVPQ